MQLKTVMSPLPNMYPAISNYEFARWAALIEAIDLIADKCEEIGIDFESDEALEYIKPLQIQRFIDERTDQLSGKITRSQSIESQIVIGNTVYDEV
jgi:hypothetical protein